MKYQKKIKYQEGYNEYAFQLKKRNWWWLLLLLLPLLLIRCERAIDVETVDAESHIGISGVDVTLDYTAHFIYKDGKFFVNEPITRTETSDSEGEVEFEKLPCSVFSYIFYCLSEAKFTIDTSCYEMEPDPESCNFHYTWHKELNLKPILTDLTLTVRDRETKDVLADALLIYKHTRNDERITDSLRTAPTGTCVLKDVPYCAIISFSQVSCYGYVDTTDVMIDVSEALIDSELAMIDLTPEKTSFTYFVKNKYNHEPVPGAVAEVIISTNKGTVMRGRSTTNVDGVGRGVYKDAFVLADLQINATHPNYKPGSLEKEYTVKQFAALPDSQRVVYLEPEPFVVMFQNVDSITGEPIKGVTNLITRKSIDGKTYNTTAYSNTNGKFEVKALEGDEIIIHSTLEPIYYPKDTHIAKFKDPQVIKMRPVLTDLTFRTVEGGKGIELPDCQLKVITSISKITEPENSGPGTFTVKGVRVGETISIAASKAGYTPNTHKIKNAKVLDLMKAPQDDRDIPLYPELPPCNGGGDGVTNSSTDRVVHSYNMGVDEGEFVFEWETYSVPDQILVYNCAEDEIFLNQPIFDTGFMSTYAPMKKKLAFDNGPIITIIGITNASDGSDWKYYVHCPE